MCCSPCCQGGYYFEDFRRKSNYFESFFFNYTSKLFFSLQFLPRTKFYVLNPVLCVLARSNRISAVEQILLFGCCLN